MIKSEVKLSEKISRSSVKSEFTCGNLLKKSKSLVREKVVVNASKVKDPFFFFDFSSIRPIKDGIMNKSGRKSRTKSKTIPFCLIEDLGH